MAHGRSLVEAQPSLDEAPLNCKIHHVAIQTASFDTSYEFYTKILGLPVAREPFQFNTRMLAWLDGGHVLIELYSLRHGVDPSAYSDSAVGIDTLAFVVDDLDVVIRTMNYYGVKITKGPLTPQSGDPRQPRILFIESPDGTPIQFREPDLPK